ncbi:MAG: hypothetical protein ACI8ZX_001429 [Planctomycetota bacterium]|jgi:hypothetical protein
MKFNTFILLSFLTFLSYTSIGQCNPSAVNPAIWGTPASTALGFTIDTNTSDEDTARITQGIDTVITMQYLLPKTQDITSPITGTATVTEVQIQGITGLPVGMNWALDASAQAQGNTYYPQTDRFGAVTLCGMTFTTPGIKTLIVSTVGCGSLSGITQCQGVSFNLYIEVLPGQGGNSAFTIAPPVGCNNMDVDFEAIFQSPDPVLFPVDFNWDFGDGSTASGAIQNAHNYSIPGDYPVKLDVVINEYYISAASVVCSGGWYPDIEELTVLQSPDPYLNIGGVITSTGSGTSASWTGLDITLNSTTITGQTFDSDNGGIFGSADDDLGSGSTTIIPSDGGVYGINTSNSIISLTVNKRVSDVLTFWDTIHVYSNSTGTITSSNGTLFCEGDSTTLDLGSGAFDFIQWYNDTTLILGETNSTMTVFTAGDYHAEILNTGNICEGNSNTINVSVDNIGSVIVSQTAAGLETDNVNGYDVQWFSNGVPIPGATNDDLTDLSSGNPFSLSITNAAGCSNTSSDFFAIMAGTSTQSGTNISSTEEITFEASDFSLCSGQDIAWAVSTAADGAITDMAELQTAIDNDWVYPSTSLNTFDANCGNTTFPAGDYFMTPFSADVVVTEPVYWNANTDSGYCDATMEICIGLSGTDYAIDPLTIELPNGTIIDIIVELGGGLVPAGTVITPDLWTLATQQLGDPACLDLISILGYYGNPNGTWIINVPNTTGTGDLNFNIDDFNITVLASTCDSLATDQIIPISGVSGTVAAGQTSSFEIVVPPLPTNFPQLTPACLLFGDATTFSSACPTAIEDVIDVENINLFPNPNNGLFTVEFDLNAVSNVNISVVDITGRKVVFRNYPNAVNRFTETFDLKDNLNSGFYFLDIQIGNEHTQKKFIVK